MSWARRLLPFAILLLAAAQIGSAMHWFGGPRPASATRIGGPFQLTDAHGVTVTDRTYLGRWMLVYFGYTHCPDICPTTLTAIAGALHQLGPLDTRIAPLFVTIDPARDTPTVIGDYTSHFDPQIVGLTGTPDQILGIEHAYKVAATTPGTMDMEHSSAIIVMDPSGNFASIIPGNANADTIAEKMRGLLKGQGPALDPFKAKP